MQNAWEATAWLQERETERAALMPHSKGALQSHDTAEQEASTGLQIHCPEKSKKGMKDLEALLFNTQWKQAEQCLCMMYTGVPDSLPWKHQQKAQ